MCIDLLSLSLWVNPQVVAMAPSVGVRAFSFSSVFPEAAAQPEVYASCARLAVCDLLNGVNGCVLVYGQTGAGKTHTMFGASADAKRAPSALGVVPRALEEVLGGMAAREAAGIASELFLAYVEVFGSEVSDLLKEGASVGVPAADGRVDFVHGHRHVLDGRADVKLESPAQASRLLAAAERCKRKYAPRTDISTYLPFYLSTYLPIYPPISLA